MAAVDRSNVDPPVVAPPTDVVLTDTVLALREEIRGLRSAAQLRALIEQAKGVLVANRHISLEEAFDQLRQMSQEHNVRLVEVAATVVGSAVPGGPEDGVELPEEVLRDRMPRSAHPSLVWGALQAEPEVRAGVLRALLDTVAGATGHGDEAAQLLAELLTGQGVSAVTIYRCIADDSLRLVGQSGVPRDVISPWSSIPPSRDIPYVRSVQDDQSFFWRDQAERAATFPAVVGGRSSFVASATVPISDAGSVVGVVGLMWRTPEEFDAQRISAITATVKRVAPLLLRNATPTDPELLWLHALLGLHLDPWLLLETVLAPDGRLVDCLVRSAAPQLPDGAGMVGRRLLELWPTVAQEGLVQSLAGLVHAGGSWSMTVAAPGPEPWGIPGSRVRAVRLGGHVVLVWRPGRDSDRRAAASAPKKMAPARYEVPDPG